ncbi:Trigger factor [termite gut metagenome]|uniref:Trigger factor n=1 Tax=termite gut metagenome TaxID=433724 RepID=A0A5J4R5I7_9ZZZZ
MNLSLQNIDKVSALLTVKLEKADYQAQVDKSLKTLRQKAQMPGFRKGMVPINLIKKMYEKSVIVEEINKLLTERVYNYIKENDIKVIGEPLPNKDKQKDWNFDATEEFEFLFDLALIPEFKVEISDKDEIDYYTIDVTDEMVNSEVKRYAQRYGKYDKVESYQDQDMLKGDITELDEDGNSKTDGIQQEGVVLMPAYLKNEEQKAIFTNAEVNNILVFNPRTAYEGNDSEIASLLDIEQKIASEVKSDFRFQITEITRYTPAELNQEFFNEVFGAEVVKSEEEFRAKIKENLTAQYTFSSQYKFISDVRKMLFERVGNDLEFSEALLKRIIKLNAKDRNEEYINENYEKTVEGLKWKVIKEQLAKKYDIKIENENLLDAAKDSAKTLFAQYGTTSIPDDIINRYADDMLKKEETVNQLIDRAIESKLISVLKEQMKLNYKTVSLEEFDKALA